MYIIFLEDKLGPLDPELSELFSASKPKLHFLSHPYLPNSYLSRVQRPKDFEPMIDGGVLITANFAEIYMNFVEM